MRTAQNKVRWNHTTRCRLRRGAQLAGRRTPGAGRPPHALTLPPWRSKTRRCRAMGRQVKDRVLHEGDGPRRRHPRATPKTPRALVGDRVEDAQGRVTMARSLERGRAHDERECGGERPTEKTEGLHHGVHDQCREQPRYRRTRRGAGHHRGHARDGESLERSRRRVRRSWSRSGSLREDSPKDQAHRDRARLRRWPGRRRRREAGPRQHGASRAHAGRSMNGSVSMRSATTVIVQHAFDDDGGEHVAGIERLLPADEVGASHPPACTGRRLLSA